MRALGTLKSSKCKLSTSRAGAVLSLSPSPSPSPPRAKQTDRQTNRLTQTAPRPPGGGGVRPHPLHTQCTPCEAPHDNPPTATRPFCLGIVMVGRGRAASVHPRGGRELVSALPSGSAAQPLGAPPTSPERMAIPKWVVVLRKRQTDRQTDEPTNK